jgi:hypothetical protein
VGPRAGLDAVEKRTNLALPGIKPGPSSPSLYGLKVCNVNAVNFVNGVSQKRPTIRYRIHSSPPLDPSQMNPIRSLTF